MKNKSNNKPNSKHLIYGVLIFAFIILTVVLYSQRIFSHRIESIVISVNSGPVSPEFQGTQKLLITPNSCQIILTKALSQGQTEQNCSITPQEFANLETYAKDYGLVDKITSNKQNNSLLGSKSYSVEIKYKDGTTFSTEGGPVFYNSILPFIEKVQTYVPEFK